MKNTVIIIKNKYKINTQINVKMSSVFLNKI